MHEFQLRLVPKFVKGRAHAVLPFANDTGCRLHAVVDLERSDGTLVSARRASLRSF